jgi:hypothetical protein
MPSTIVFGLLSAQILAALPVQGNYFNPLKIILFLGAILLWAYTTVWIQKSGRKVKINDKKWIFMSFGAGILSLAAWLFLPWFSIGLVIYAALFGAAAISYSMIFNKRVPPAQAVLTMAHL